MSGDPILAAIAKLGTDLRDELADPILAEIDGLRRWVFWGVVAMWVVALAALFVALHYWSPR